MKNWQAGVIELLIYIAMFLVIGGISFGLCMLYGGSEGLADDMCAGEGEQP